MFRTEELRGVAAGTFFGLVIAIFSGALPARTDPIDDLFASENSQLDGEETLYLTVVLNGKDIGQFIEVLFDPITERLSASGMALAEIGIETSGPSAGRVFLDTVENAVFHYETATQELIVTAENDALLPVKISGRSAQSIPEPQPGRGIVLNYSATSSLEQDRPNGGLSFGAVRARLELRAFNSFGSLSTNGSISSRDGRFRRDATAFTRSSPSLRITTTLGDFAASGLDWARPIRMAGLQIKRDFALSGAVMNRPELSWSGVATLPSTVEVFVDNVRAWAGEVPSGPFVLTDIPMISSSGDAVIVLRDETGQEQRTSVPFFSSQELLRAGATDFALQFGRARRGSDAYDDRTLFIVSGRHGVTDRLTLEAHAEGTTGLLMGGLGFGTTLGSFGEMNVALAFSRHGQDEGRLAFASWHGDVGAWSLNISSRMTSRNYFDLARIIDEATDGFETDAIPVSGRSRQNALTVTRRFTEYGSNLAVGVIGADRDGMKREILSVSWSQGIGWRNGTLSANAVYDLFSHDAGVSLGLSVPLGGESSASTSLGRDQDGSIRSGIHLSRPMGQNPGSWGYRLDIARSGRTDVNMLDLDYTGATGVANLSLQTTDNRFSATASVNGALAIAGNGVFASRPIKDSFAVVSVGVPGVPVMLNNRVEAKTGWFGRALVSGLAANRSNRISIDPTALPISANVSATSMDVVPATGAGVAVTFGTGQTNGAQVQLNGSDGLPLPVGTAVKLNGRVVDVPVGYDGLIWLEGLVSENELAAEIEGRRCVAHVSFDARTLETNEVLVAICN